MTVTSIDIVNGQVVPDLVSAKAHHMRPVVVALLVIARTASVLFAAPRWNRGTAAQGR